MHTFVLQDWVTIQGSGSGAGNQIIQTAEDWLDLSPFQDVFFWIAVSEVTASSTINLFFDTSPTDDESLFQSMTGTGTPAITPLVASSSPAVIKLPMLSATVPLSRYLRWRLTSSTMNWNTTMRIVVAANSPGM